MNHLTIKIAAGLAVLGALILLAAPKTGHLVYAEQASVGKQAIRFPDVKPSTLPFSTAIKHGNTLFISGVIGTDLHTGELVSQDIAQQTHQCLKKLETVLREAGMDLSHAVNVTVYLTDLDDYNLMNQAYGEHFKDMIPPARACIQVAGLVKEAKIEISMIAMK